MMKTAKIIALFVSVVMGITLVSCIQDDAFSVPHTLNFEENEALDALLASDATEISIVDLKAKFAGNYYLAMPIDTNVYIKGYVSSSDRMGNFFKEIFLQDAPENPTAGIRIILEQVESHTQYNIGREVYISLKGLYIGEERVGDGLITIGGSTETNQFGTAVKRLSENQKMQHLFRSSTTFDLIPLPLNLSQVSAKHIGLYVQLMDVEFADDLAGKRYFDPTQDFDTLRLLQSCTGSIDYARFILKTSSFALFKDELLPTGNGTINGVISKTFDGSALVLELNDLTDVNLVNTRCLPLTLDDFEQVFYEDFELAASSANFSFEGWVNYVEVGNVGWREKNTDGNGYAEFSAFNSFNPSNIAWLITPGFDTDIYPQVFLTFKAAQHHVESPHNTMEILISSNFDGINVLDATWLPIEAALPTQYHNWYEFIDSGLIDISAYSGILHLAFKVTGSGTITNMAGSYQLDDLRILTIP